MKTTFLPLGLLALFTSLAQGIILYSDDFTYPDGPIIGAPGSPWLPNSGTAGSALITNSALIWSTARTEDIAVPLSMTVETNGVVPFVYASFIARFTGVPNAAGTYLAHFTGDPLSAHRGRVWVFTNGASASGKVRIGIVNSSNPAMDPPTPWPNELDTNVAYKVVTRFSMSTGIATLWIDPAAESDPSVSASDPPGLTNILHYAFRQSTGIGTSVIDNLRVGTTFNDVAGANNPPSITALAPQKTPANTPASIAFTVGDAETAADNLVLSGTSSNPSLVPNDNITFGGSASNRTVTLTPAPGQQGTTTVTITVTDADQVMNSTPLHLSVGLPSISDIPNQVVATNTPAGPIAFTISDAETEAGNLLVTASSSNPGLVPNANIVVGGSGANRAVTVIPAPHLAGFAIITITVSDGVVTSSDTFVLTVYPNIGVVKFDDFNRPDGPLVTGNGAWLSHSGTILGEAKITNNALKITFAQTEDVSTELTNSPYLPSSGAIFYTSFKLKVGQLPTSAGDYFAHLKDDGAQNFRCRIFARTSGAVPGTFRLGLANNNATPSIVFPADLETNATHFVVSRYNAATSVSTLWVNPTSDASPSVTATDNPTPVAIHTYAFRENAGMGTLYLDDLTVGGTFSDVLAASYKLTITASGRDVQISWPVAAAGFHLQFTDALPATWTDSPDPVSVEGDQNIVRYVGTTGRKFFRLIKP